MTLAELSLKRPVSAIMFFVSMVAIGLIASVRLPLEQFPSITFPGMFIQLPYPGSTPVEVERNITRPAEEALATLPGIENIYSTSTADNATLFVQFSDWNKDVSIAASEARDRLDAIRDDLPDDLQRYFVQKFSTSDEPLLRVRFAGDRDLSGDYNLLQRTFQRRIERLPGVAKVEITGAPPPEVEIALDVSRISASGISLNQLAAKLQSQNFSVSAGDISDGERRLRVQPVGELRSIQEIRDLTLNERGLRLSDVAEVRLKSQRVDFRRRLEGRAAVGLDIFREQNANLVAVSDSIHAELAEIAEEPEFEGLQIKIISDQAVDVQSSIDELIEAGLLGSLLSMLVLFYFLRHWPSTLMVTLAIPLCIVMTLGSMYFFGLTLNVLTMMGLLLAIGMMVDNAVVVVESIYQYREKYPDDPMRCAIEGTRSVQLAISAGTLTSIIVFAPNLFGEVNQMSIFLGQVALTITISLLASWLVAVSLIPMISARIGTPPSVTNVHGFIPALSRKYSEFLRWTLQHRLQAWLGIALIMLVSFIPATRTEFDFFKNDAGREIEMYFNWNGSYSLDQIDAEIARFEKHLDERREKYQIEQIYSYFSEQGWAGIRLTLRDPNPSILDRLMLRNAEAGLLSTGEVQELVRKDLPKSARAEVGFQGGGPPGSGGGGQDEGISFQIKGDSPEMLKDIAESIIPLLNAQPELRDARVDTGDNNSEIQVSVNRERATSLGFNAEEVARYIAIALRGQTLREFREGEAEIPVTARFAGAEHFKIENLNELKLLSATGVEVPLMSLVDVSVREGASQIQRQNRQTSLNIKANLPDKGKTEDARKAIERVMGSAQLPPGYSHSLGGNFERNDEAGADMLVSTLVALLMIYIVMAALFESVLFPSAIITSVFFSWLGMFWLFWLTGTTFTIMASIGLLVLMGVVVNNGIVMFEHINQMRRAGVDRLNALVNGSTERLRPILMTMGTTILGMLPLCVGGTQIGGDGPGYYPMARAIVGGLIFSTIVSLLFLPTIYATLDDMRMWCGERVRQALGNRAEGSGA